jgi:hypothetical protein
MHGGVYRNLKFSVSLFHIQIQTEKTNLDKTTAIHGRKLHLDLINYLFWGIDLTNYLRGPVHNTSKVD